MTVPPCRLDAMESGRDWTDLAPPRTAAEVREMAAQCHTCPLRWRCFLQAESDAPNSEGVWGGFFWRKGKAIDPFGKVGRRRSIYPSVVWEGRRSSWKAFAQIDGQFFHVGQSTDEDEAYEMVEQWWREREEQEAA